MYCSAEKIFAEDLKLNASIEKRRKRISTTVQGGLTIDGILLLQLLELIQIFEASMERLGMFTYRLLDNPPYIRKGKPGFLEALPRLMGDCYVPELLKDYPHFANIIHPSALLYEALLGYNAALPPKKRFSSIVAFMNLENNILYFPGSMSFRT